MFSRANGAPLAGGQLEGANGAAPGTPDSAEAPTAASMVLRRSVSRPPGLHAAEAAEAVAVRRSAAAVSGSAVATLLLTLFLL